MSEWKSLNGTVRRESEIELASTILLDQGIAFEDIRESVSDEG